MKKYNIIKGEININKDNINKDIQIINSFENVKRNEHYAHSIDNFKYDYSQYENEKEIKNNIQIKIDGEIIHFPYYCYSKIFRKEGKYNIEYSFKNNLTKTDYMFSFCESLIYLNLSNFNTQNITNMSWMFYKCRSLIILNLSNFNTQNVTNMSWMFYKCNSLTNLNLTNFNIQNIRNMSFMFDGCKFLKNNIITKDNKIFIKFDNDNGRCFII